MKRPKFLRSRKWKSAVKVAKVRQAAKDRYRKVRSNGHKP